MRSRPLAFLVALTLAPLAHAQVAGEGQLIKSERGGLARFVEKGVDAATIPPSIALVRPQSMEFTGPADATIKAKPLFWTTKDSHHCVRIDIEAGTSLYGTGEAAGPLLRNGRKTVCWNTDAPGYNENTPSLYQSHPWVLAVRADGTAFGVFADTTWRCEIDLTGEDKGSQASGSIVFRAEGALYAVYVIDRDSPQNVMKGLAELIGTMPMPPLWALGYHQCRFSYTPEAKVREIAQRFRDKQIPCDTIWFDIDYMDGFRVFTFDKAQFPDVKKLSDDLDAMGFHRVFMVDPGVKAEPGYGAFDQLTSKNLAVMDSKGELYKGEVWPGLCAFPDFTNTQTRLWWSGLYKGLFAKGASGVWNDMNEPSVFNSKTRTMPEDNRHAGGPWDSRIWLGGSDEAKSTLILPPGQHSQYHNVYGTLMAKATMEGAVNSTREKRAFVLTRAGSMGSQRYAATWTGDNSATWADLEYSVSMIENLGLSGQPFSGPDIGGFSGNGPTGKDDAETLKLRGQLFARWMGVGSLLPFCRGHTDKRNIDKEPWAFGPEVERTCKLALQRRYRLLPYLYTLFWEAHQTGMPVVRPVFFDDPKDPALRSEDDAFLLGDNLLVVPKLTPERDRVPVQPKGIWNEVQLVDEGHHPDLPRLYVKGGTIVPIGEPMDHVPPPGFDAKVKPKPITLLVSLNEGGNAIGKLYEDDNDGFDFMRGQYSEVTYMARTDDNGNIIVESVGKDGKWAHPPRDVRIMILKDGGYTPGVGTDGMKTTFIKGQIPAVQFHE